jgi:hypothetical protein
VPWSSRHTPRPARGTLESCLISGHHDGQELHEVWCHKADTQEWLAGGIATVNGRPCTVHQVDTLPYADQLRILVAALT